MQHLWARGPHPLTPRRQQDAGTSSPPSRLTWVSGGSARSQTLPGSELKKIGRLDLTTAVFKNTYTDLIPAYAADSIEPPPVAGPDRGYCNKVIRPGFPLIDLYDILMTAFRGDDWNQVYEDELAASNPLHKLLVFLWRTYAEFILRVPDLAIRRKPGVKELNV